MQRLKAYHDVIAAFEDRFSEFTDTGSWHLI
jgi:hypothetical protein